MTQSTDLRGQIYALWQEVRAKQEELVKLLHEQGPEPVENHVLEGPDGEVKLSELFGEKKDLLVVHNMGRGCPYCTLWADGFNGLLPHIEDRTAFVVVSPDAPEVQAEFARSRGWRFRMLSGGKSDFTAAMGYVGEHEGKPHALPGCSTFRKADDGSITRIAHSPFGPGDAYCSVFHLFDLLEGGVGEWQAKLDYGTE